MIAAIIVAIICILTRLLRFMLFNLRTDAEIWNRYALEQVW